MMLRRLAVVLVALAVPLGAHAQTQRAFAPAVEAMVSTVVVPAHERFAAAAAEEAGMVAALCAAPGGETLAAARTGFVALVAAFSEVEPYRFGPARADNRIERLFFWPDRRGRGLRQVQRLLAEEDQTATGLDTLVQKSVAVQGLPALEYALFGTGSDTLAEAAGFRCRYAQTVSRAIVNVADALLADWVGPFGETMRTAGADNPVYRSHGEALQDLLQAAAEQLELVAAYKLRAAVGGSVDDAKPKRMPYWRSGADLVAVAGNVAAARALMVDELDPLLGDQHFQLRSARFELDQAGRALAGLIQRPEATADLMANEETHRRLAYIALPVSGAQSVLSERIPAALGLIAGFNALDGD